MALRCFGSPRFTVYDADFSTSAETVNPPASMTELLRYSDEDLDIIPAAAMAADRRETLIQIEPIRFDAAFTSIALADQDQQFKADISFRGLLLDGREVPFETPYSLELWERAANRLGDGPRRGAGREDPRLVRTRLVKHYADAAWITIAAQAPGSPLAFAYPQLREMLHDKLELMRRPAARTPTAHSPASRPSSASSPNPPNSTECSGRSSSTCKLTAPLTRRKTCAASSSRPSPPGIRRSQPR